MRLQYEIATTGADQLRSVLRGVEREAAASDKRLSRERKATAKGEARERAGLMHGPGRREQLAGIRQAERAQATANARAMREQAAARRQQQRQASLAIKTEERARIASEKTVARARESLDRQRSRALFQLHQQNERQEKRRTDERRTSREKLGRGFARSVSSATGTVTQLGTAAIGVAGGFAAADALREESSIRRQASQLANQAGTPGLKHQLATEATTVRGVNGTETLQGMGRFVGKTGDLDTARQLKGSMGELSLATGADFGDLMETAGQAFNVLKDQISDPVKRLNELNSLMGVLAQQGALGAVEIRDLAQDFGKLGAATRGFEGTAPDLLRTMGAFAQVAVARGGAESSADASTAASRMVGDIVTNRKKFAGIGVDVKSKSDPTKLRDPMSIITDVLEKTGGDVSKTSSLFGLESGKIFKGFAATYSEAEKQKKGSGKKAVMAEYNRFAGAKMDPATIKAQADSRMSDPDKQFEEASKAFSTAVGRELLPAVTKLIPEFAKMIPVLAEATGQFAKFIGWFSQNPLSGLGVIIGAAVAKDVASAGIGKLLESTVMSLLAQTRLGGGLPVGAAGGLAGKVGAVGLAAGGVALAVDQAQSWGQENGGWEGAKSWLGVGKGKGWGFDAVDDMMNQDARERAAREPAGKKLSPPGFLHSGTGSAAPGMVRNEARGDGFDHGRPLHVPDPIAPAAGSEELKKAALEQSQAAAAMKSAADALKSSLPPGPHRTQPIISKER
jgi:hypothetical protein